MIVNIMQALLLSSRKPYFIHLAYSRQSQLPVKGISVRFSPQETLQRLHFILAASLLEHHVPVSPSFFAVHGIFLEDGEEHVCAVDLARKVAVVACVVAAEEVAKGRLSVSCCSIS